MVLQLEQRRKNRDGRTRRRTVIAVAYRCVEVGAGALLYAFQYRKQPAQPVSGIRIVFVQRHLEFLLSRVTVDARLDDRGARVTYIGDWLSSPLIFFCLFGADAANRTGQKGLRVGQIFDHAAHHIAAEVGRNVLRLAQRGC